ncbi:RNA-guided pseudouridylation complex pseudouridine synthase subunit Cbf5 [Oxyplasma meridianum]|uniref:Probable tRNA pseudouridine synthase B n=1 Tax=Oxyplasma meridianum TaxID=3073602 RepID=A0AAX4NIV8_9ARCH
MNRSKEKTSADFLEGFIVIDKPKGPTSHQIDYWVRSILGIEKVAHIGTLDPSATGVLVMALGRAVKLVEIAHEMPKEYVGVMFIHEDVGEEKVRKVMEEFTGEIYQIPPVRSAVSRNLRTRWIYSLEIIEKKGRDILFRVRSESGTYVRTLCTDMGYVLGTGGQLMDLRRTASGIFSEKDAVTLQDLSDAMKLAEEGENSALRKIVFPMDYLFRDYGKIVVKASAIQNIAHGSDLFPGGIKAIIGTPLRGDRVVAISDTNEILASGKMLVSYSQITDTKVVDFDRVMLDPNPKKVNFISGSVEKPARLTGKVTKPEQRKNRVDRSDDSKFREDNKKVVRRDKERKRDMGLQRPQNKFHRDFRRPEKGRDSRKGNDKGEKRAFPARSPYGVRKKKNKR